MKILFLLSFLTSFYSYADVIRIEPGSVEYISKVSADGFQVKMGHASWSYHDIIKFEVKLKNVPSLKFCFKYVSEVYRPITYPADVTAFVKAILRSSRQEIKESSTEKNGCKIENANIVWTPSELDQNCSEPKFFIDEVALNCN